MSANVTRAFLSTAVIGFAMTIGGLVFPATASAQSGCVPGLFVPGQSCEIHFDKIIFRPADGSVWICGDDQMDPYNEGEVFLTERDVLDIKVPDDPRRVADVKQKVVDFLDGRCTRKALIPGHPDASRKPITKRQITIIDVDYAILPLVELIPQN